MFSQFQRGATTRKILWWRGTTWHLIQQSLNHRTCAPRRHLGWGQITVSAGLDRFHEMVTDSLHGNTAPLAALYFDDYTIRTQPEVNHKL
mmetsp:Transcript_78925/g.228128  ORF Transcript_78925/g.228128 Transcript_78925/m.228128 type:complete len:90 (+) Transcript_78925:532-801(+)